MKALLDEINVLLQDDDAGEPLEESMIHEEPELVSFDFLTLDCLEKDIGRAMAIRNYWVYRCNLP
jgi:hypothetical protein